MNDPARRDREALSENPSYQMAGVQMRESLTGNDIPSGCLRPDTSRIVRLSADMGVEFSIAEPLAIRCDNGPELTSRHFLAWCIERKITLVHIQPGRPQQNGLVESFHARLRDECLNVSWFLNLWDARRKIAAWQEEYKLTYRMRISYDPPCGDPKPEN